MVKPIYLSYCVYMLRLVNGSFFFRQLIYKEILFKCQKTKYNRDQCYHLITSLRYTLIGILPNPFYLPLKPQLYTCPKNLTTLIHTHIIVNSSSPTSIRRKYRVEIPFFCIICVFHLLPIYIFLYMNWLRVEVLLFHFTRLYKRKTWYIRIG